MKDELRNLLRSLQDRNKNRDQLVKDLKDVKEHKNDPIEPKDHDTMDDAVEDL